MKGTYSLSLTSEQINAALNRVHNKDFIEKDSLDSTFSEQGVPAESKAIGDRLTEVLGYIASPYDSSKTYKAKDLCSYENQIYICVTDINKPEWFNNSHWASATIGAALTSITQMEDLITHLITLRGLTAAEFDAVAQSGRAREFFKVGDVIYIPWTDYNADPVVKYEIPHIIVDFIDANGEDGSTYEVSPVLEWMYAIPTSLPFDAAERIPVNEGETIESGYYYFDFNDPSYVLLDPQPAVGSVVPAGKTYYKHTWSNAASAIRFGLNNYHLGAYRQWLNADVGLNVGWWTAQHDSDCSPTNYVGYAGFLYGYDESWKKIFKKVEVKTIGNTDIFGGEVDTDYDYFFLPAVSQIGGSQSQAAVTGDVWEYWRTVLAENYPAADRTEYEAYKISTYPGNTDPVTTRLRSCRVAYVGDTYTMTSAGVLNDYGHSSGSYKALPATVILGKKRIQLNKIYGFHIDSNNPDPSEKVTYLADAVGMTPAHMDFTNDRFDLGSWRGAFFFPRPCMLKYDGTVDYYLDPDDYSKRADGTPSDVADFAYNGNAMVEWGQNGQKIWYKIVPDEDPTSASVYIADYQVDEDYLAWSFINNQGVMVDHFYTPIYNGTIDGNGRLRSISGKAYTDLCQNKLIEQEIAAAELNNPGTNKLWYTEVYADITIINLLLILMGKSLNSQTVYGAGRCGVSEASHMLGTGTMDDKGLFWGSESNDYGVKVFGMENWWGNIWRRYAGHIIDNYVNKYKMTRGRQDGSTADDYNTTAIGYLTGVTAPSALGGWITKMQFNENCFQSVEFGGSQSTYWCDYWIQHTLVKYAAHGGHSIGSAGFVATSTTSGQGPFIGASLSCKPLS